MTREYVIGDARDLPDLLPEPAVAAAVDLAWARPHRNGVYVTYPTYGPESGLWDFVDAVREALADGGWAFFDADSWLLPRLINYLRETWGDVAATYRGGGYRRTGWVMQSGGGGHYFRNGGYPVVFAHKGETDRTAAVDATIGAAVDREVKREVAWGTLKPVAPYEQWLGAVTEPGEHIAIPCAGTAPAAIALERLYGDDATYTAVDSQSEAREAFKRRREIQVVPTQDQLAVGEEVGPGGDGS